MTPPVSDFAPAKVNLCLHVTGRRSDGYHLLDSLVVFACIGDGLRATRAEALGLTIDGPFAADVPAGEDNLVLRAARLAAGDMMSKSWPQSPRRAMISRLACDEGPRRRT